MGSHGSSHRNSHQKPTSPPYRLGFSLPLLGLLERGLDGHPHILSISNIIKQLQSQRYLGLSKPDLKARSNAGSYDVKLLAVGCLLLAMQHWWGRQSFMKNIHNRHWLFPKVKEIAHLCDLCDAQSWVPWGHLTSSDPNLETCSAQALPQKLFSFLARTWAGGGHLNPSISFDHQLSYALKPVFTIALGRPAVEVPVHVNKEP